MIIKDFTEPELQIFREKCNFTDLESIVFENRSKGMTLQEIADNYNFSVDYARKLSQKVNKKDYIFSTFYVYFKCSLFYL